MLVSTIRLPCNHSCSDKSISFGKSSYWD